MEAVEQGRVAVEGGQVAYRVYGTGSRALLCLHGGPGCPSPSIESLVDLASADLRVVLYDQLGCGDSEAPDDPSLWTLERFVREVEQVRSALDLGRVDLFGHSFGGILAQEWALAHPELLRGLVLASTTSSIPQLRDAFMALLASFPEPQREALLAGESAPGYREAQRAFLSQHMCRIPYPEPVSRAFATSSELAYDQLWGPEWFSITGSLADWDVSEAIRQIQAPTLITVGRYDEVPTACAERIRSQIAGSEL